jgi:anti-sigma regulatory factor (Ser/Thr protein kinase)
MVTADKDNKEKRLASLSRKCRIILSEIQMLGDQLMEESFYHRQLYDFITECLAAAEHLESQPVPAFPGMRDFVNRQYFHILNAMKDLFSRMVLLGGDNCFTPDKWKNRDKTTLFFANYVMMHQNYRSLKDIIGEYFVDAYKSSYELVCDEHSPLFDVSEMHYMEVRSELASVRNVAGSVLGELEFKDRLTESDLVILSEQISEILKNAVLHGNKQDQRKKVMIWYRLTDKFFKLIVGDEGEGFTNLEEWNAFNKKRNEALKKGDMEEMLKYVQYKGPHSTAEDGGNSLFAAIEYWDSSLVYNARRNKVAALKYL